MARFRNCLATLIAQFVRLFSLLLIVSLLGAATGRSDDEATIFRDDWGVPHIYAQSEEAGFYALGYAQAEDRLTRILDLYMSALGRGAEVHGVDYLPNDERVALWRHVEESRAGFARLSPQLSRNYEAFAAGINRYMDEHPQAVPEWAPTIEPFLPLLFERYVRWNVTIRAGIAECRLAGAKISRQIASVESDDPYHRAASNEWALSPWRTADNAAVLLGDPHGASFGYRYEFYINAGPLESFGHTDIGAALPILGHSRHVAWTWTTGAPDTADCYRVVLTDDGSAYRYDAEVVPLVQSSTTFNIRGEEPVRHQYRYTRHNGVLSPVVAVDGDVAWVVSTPYMHNWERWDEEMYRQNLARNVDEFRQALALLGHHGENVMAADSSGNILYVRTGRTPIRPPGFDGASAADGNTSATAWLGVHTIDDLVQIKNPPQGYMQNNNVPPQWMMKDSPLTPDRYPPYIYNSDSGAASPGERPRLPRGDLANDKLARAFHYTTDDALALALDHEWPYVGPWRTALRQTLDTRAADLRSASPQVRALAQRLLEFDGQAAADSSAALGYYYWRKAMEVGMKKDELEAMARRIDLGGAVGSAEEPVLYDALRSAAATIDRISGSGKAVLGDVFRIRRQGEELDITAPVSGPAFKVGDLLYPPLRVFYFHPPEDGTSVRWAFGGSKAIRLTVFTRPLQSFSLVQWGSSDGETSPHFADQIHLLREPRLKRNYFGREQLEGHIAGKTVLTVTIGKK